MGEIKGRGRRSRENGVSEDESCGSSFSRGVQIQHVEEESSSSSKSFKEKCSHLAKKQRAKFYILRRCVTMLLCSHERNDPLD